MPFKKRNAAVLSQKKFLKSRLMQISICVDNYIYTNKSISVEDATRYINEIAVYRTQCEGDIHSLQVIEKLTRLMKTIIEETAKKNSHIQNVTTTDKESIGIISERSVNNSQDNATYNNFDNITTNPNFPCNNAENQNSTVKVSAILTPEEISNNTETSSIIIIESDNDILDCTLVTEKGLNKNVCCNASKNADSILGSSIIAQSSLREKKDIKNPLSEKNNCEQKNFHVTSTTNTPFPINDGNSPNIYAIVNDATGNKCFLRSEVNPKQSCKKTRRPPLRIDKINTNRNENKNVATEQELPKRNRLIKKNKKSAAVQNTPVVEKKRRKSQKDATKERPTTNNLSKQRKMKTQNLIPSTHEERLSIERNTNTYTVQNKDNHTHVNLIKNYMFQTSSHPENDINLSVNDETLISTQMNSLKIYNEQVENDLSWVESIRYVREVSNDEFDSNLSNLEENFWHNVTLPNGWSDIEFLY